ncbi:MAG: hypothetical protein K2Y32_01340 [Candidatus Obscuribacterales bacterium]|nr:hypothetical protein [Candidatus Obscuribacterales bacterium]
MKVHPVLLIIIAGALYLSYALYTQKSALRSENTALSEEPPAEMLAASSSNSKSLSISVPKQFSEAGRKQVAHLLKPIAQVPFSSHEKSLCHFAYIKLLEHSEEGDSIGAIERLKVQLQKLGTEPSSAAVLQILSDGEKNDSKSGLKHCLEFIDQIDLAKPSGVAAQDKLPALAQLVPFLYGARFALMEKDDSEAISLAQEGMPLSRRAGDFGLGDLETIYYSSDQCGADFNLYRKAAGDLIAGVKAGKKGEFRDYSADLLKSLGDLDKRSYHVLNARMGGVLMQEYSQRRIEAIEDAKSVRDRAKECGDLAVEAEAGKIAEKLEHP